MRFGLLVFFALSCTAQGLPSNWVGLGGTYNSSSRPPVAGWFAYALLLSQSGQVYSVSTHDVFLSQTKPHTLQSSVRSGLATPVRVLGPLILLGLGDAGMAAGGTTVGGAFSGGGIGILRLGHTNWTIAAGGRLLKISNGGSQTIVHIGFGRSF